MSSTEETEEASDACCTNCGVAEFDDIKLLEECDCDLEKYCSDECRKNHQEQHDGECKKREVELNDDTLFRQPDGTHEGECPICFLPMPLEPTKSSLFSCCSKSICYGCDYA